MSEERLHIYSGIPQDQSWAPIHHMISLAAELLDAELYELNHTHQNWARRISSLLTTRRRARKKNKCLFVCCAPNQLSDIYSIQNWNTKYDFIAAWIIDSFWIDWISIFTRLSHPFDHLFITSNEDIPEWERLTRTPTTWLPWGSDVLRFGNGTTIRNLDLLRVGRQPDEWEDDVKNQIDCHQVGISYHGRPSSGDSIMTSYHSLMRKYSEAKLLLAFSNIANPTNYTHPTREYLTGRWVDALACGATVAGIPPREPSIDALLWPNAILDLQTTSKAAGLKAIAEYLSTTWNISIPKENHSVALKRLDWRWRFQKLSNILGINSKLLNDEIGEILRDC